MHLCLVLSCLLGVVCSVLSASTHTSETHIIQELENKFASFQKNTKETIKSLSRQLMLQQLYVEERIRSEGDSGIKQTRYSRGGTRPYFSNSYSNYGPASGHDHANYDRTTGLGEFIAVLNGVEFRTRHNDYKIRMPSTKNKNWNELEDIPFPPVPPTVLNKRSVHDQIIEMRQYFRAFHEQNTTIRDWRPYFKPAMCYLEGGWTTSTKTLEEPFHSDRHQIEASSWLDLQEKIRFTAYSGSKNNNENLSYLPTTIINVTDDGMPVFSQWNYRIACHPIKTSFDLRYIRAVDDLAQRMRYRTNMTKYAISRNARFQVLPSPGHYDKTVGHSQYHDREYVYGKMDQIMEEIPGKDNYPGHLTGDSFGKQKYNAHGHKDTLMNTARYHRVYKVKQEDGDEAATVREDGFSDRNLWVAETSSPHIANVGVNDCHHDNANEVCTRHEGRYTYAIPLEIIWLTPLSTWNPYNVTVHDWKTRYQVYSGGRDGQLTASKAYNGIGPDTYYLTPAEFFSGNENDHDPADTTKNVAGVLDQHGKVRSMKASGIRFFLPEISGVGTIRTRYPVMPVHQEGNVIWKNLQALQDITMDMKSNTRMFEKRPELQNVGGHEPDAHYITNPSWTTPPVRHAHDIFITAEDMMVLRTNGTIKVYTTEEEGHQHEMELKQDPQRSYALLIMSCDNQKHCFDNHGDRVYEKPRV